MQLITPLVSLLVVAFAHAQNPQHQPQQPGSSKPAFIFLKSLKTSQRQLPSEPETKEIEAGIMRSGSGSRSDPTNESGLPNTEEELLDEMTHESMEQELPKTTSIQNPSRYHHSEESEPESEENHELVMDTLHAEVARANPNFLLPTKRRSRADCPPEVLGRDDELWWACRQRQTWRHLGENFYPSQLWETVCEEGRCFHDHYNCTPIAYTLLVLRSCNHGCQDQRVPFPLRSRWQWQSINVTVGCQCVR
ncbi:hypothetical protein BaRGS_00009065 [Batillaria attramentaria]|uniref:Uncharacterized protein n=1 Tax=Batillaria attramentaria TaxID=370345 RepID=A0ABD0LJN3_9CAEN